GTDGWRSVIGEGFTFENVRRVARAHAEVLREKGSSKVLIGYDRRFLSDRFALEVCRVMASEGLDPVLTSRPCTTPMVSFGVRYMGFDGGVMITASHNPPEYNGYKIKEGFGGSARTDFLKEVEAKIKEDPVCLADRTPRKVELEDPYLEKVLSFFDTDLFREREVLLIHDPMHGTSAGLLARALSDTKVRVLTVRAERDPLFGGSSPEPVERNLRILSEKVRSVSADLGIANDGDGDRVGLVDEKGRFVSTQIVYALLLYHQIKNRGRRDGVVVKTVSTTYLADRICGEEGIEIREVPVGFKNVNEVILKEKVVFGGEESGGYGFPEFLPERDGIFSALMVLEMVLLMGESVSGLVSRLFKTYGEAYYRRVDLTADERVKRKLKELTENPPTRLGSKVVDRVLTLDGLKLVFRDGSWLLLRPSGTEPLVRIYAEAPSPEEVKTLIREGESLITV
ncbi:MAG: phosphoglucomutase/phosphomannomutase family protein, partial [Aquificota bacterium]|nr:phosphoglucomutase/phosphomannomutase family protein [Aquificota bacterium]